MKHHLITHTGETPFLCLHCWKSFSSHIDLKLHIKKEHLMHLNTDTGGTKLDLEEASSPAKRGSAGQTPVKKAVKKKRTSNGLGKIIRTNNQYSQRNPSRSAEVEEKTSHFVQLDDGTYAEMVEGHEMVAPGHQMLVEDQDGQKLVVVNPAPGDEPQTIVVPEQAETVYVIGEQYSAQL